MTEPTPTAAEQLRNAQQVLAMAGVSTNEVLAGLDAFRRADVRNAPPAQPCTHPDGCTNPATHQTQRDATPDEAEAHWAALEQNIRASNSGRPEAEYVHPRTDPVTIAEFRCDLPKHADPAYLEAKARQEQPSPAANLGGHAAPVEFTTDEHGQPQPHWPTNG